MTLTWKTIVIVAGLVALVWLAAMGAHSARAEEVGPKWKLVVTLEGPPGKQNLTFGDKEKGVHWYTTKDECEKTRKGGTDPKYDAAWTQLKKLQADYKKQNVPIEFAAACVLDDSV